MSRKNPAAAQDRKPREGGFRPCMVSFCPGLPDPGREAFRQNVKFPMDVDLEGMGTVQKTPFLLRLVTIRT